MGRFFLPISRIANGPFGKRGALYNNNSRFQWLLAAIDAAPPPLWRAHQRRVAGATSHRPAHLLSSLDSRLLILLAKRAAVAGSVDSRDRAGELRWVIH